MSKTRDELDYQQVPTRIHVNDYKLMKKLLVDDGMSYSAFVRICVRAYLDGNAHFLKILKVYKDVVDLPQSLRETYTLSQRERALMLKELEEQEKNEEIESQEA